MSTITSLVVGLIAGFLASKLISKTGEGHVLGLVLSNVGGPAGEFIFKFVGYSVPTGSDLYSMVAAFVGAVTVLPIYHVVFRRRAL